MFAVLIYYTEKKINTKRRRKITEFAWITSIKITKNNASYRQEETDGKYGNWQGEYRACMQLECKRIIFSQIL